MDTAAAVLLDPQGRVLVVPHPRFGLSLPGGHVEVGETPAEAAVREVREETGLVCRLLAATPLRVTATPGAPSCAWFAGWADGKPQDGAWWCAPERLTLPFPNDAVSVAEALAALAAADCPTD